MNIHPLLLCPMAALLIPFSAAAQDAPPPSPPSLIAADPLADFTSDWRNDEVWYNGKAEVATYSAARTVYGKPRKYTATLYTNKERLDLASTTKADGEGEGRVEVFKHHLREDIPTPNYDYHYSTMVYVGSENLHPYKLDMGSIESCGTTFKRYWLPMDGPMQWMQASYFPRQGVRDGEVEAVPGLVFHNALSLLLRGYPFDHPPQDMELRVVPDATTNKWSPVEPVRMRVRYEGVDSLNGLPFGSVNAHHLVVEPVNQTEGVAGDERVREPATPIAKVVPDEVPQAWHYWFDRDPGNQHVMVKMIGPAPGGGALAYELSVYEREAYWELQE